MAEIMSRDILLRIGGATLRRYKRLTASRGVQGWEETKETFARATVKRAYRDRDGTARRAAAGKLALDWPTGLVDAAGNAIGGPLIESARPQLVTDPENFGAWTVENSVGRTSGQTDPYGGTAAYLLDSNTPASNDGVFQIVGFTGDATKAYRVALKQGTAAQNSILIYDATAAAARHRIFVTWTAGVPALSTNQGGGTLYTPVSLGTSWYEAQFTATGIIAANVNRFYIRPDNSAGGGTVYAYGANAWNSVFPTSYQAPGESAGVADALTSGFNFGPQSDLTVLVRLSRPLYASLSGALGASPGIFSFGAGTAPRIGLYFDPAARNIISAIDTATTDATQTTAIPAGDPIICVQYRNLTTGGSTALDVGSGLTAFSSAATAFSAFSSQTLRVGRYDDELNGVIGDLVVARGLYSRAEMMAIP